ncbi:MAG: lipid kinase YegS, partial [Gammaproteobacteria bacterium HGW-Gammaproteobacteria-7]
MSDAKALLILHGKQALNDEVREAVRQQRDYGWDLAVRVTWEPGDAQRLVAEALDAGYSKLVAGGGDGTLREVAEALLQAQA